MAMAESEKDASERLNYRPEILDPSDPKCRERLRILKEQYKDDGILISDTILAQLRDFVRATAPSAPPEGMAIQLAIERLTGCQALGSYGRWVYHPWLRRLVHLLPPEQFQIVRQDRNRHKIEAHEQAHLRQAVVGIVGLSVGNAIARTLALEGTVGRLRLADHDVLDLSNLNRLNAGIYEIGFNKAVIAARQISEVDPYTEVEIFYEGLTEETLDRFLIGPPALDVLIDECDSLDIKLLMREQARAMRIPVLMETSDRGMLDVERFDIEPDRPVIHGRLGDLRAVDVSGLTTEGKVPHVLRILEPEEISARLAASMTEIGRTVTTWPQLASEVQLGGATVAVAIRRLLLGLPLPSGRRYIDLDHLVAAPVEALSVSMDRKVGRASRPAPERSSVPVLEPIVRWLAEHAILAPSAGNCQPWRFVAGHSEELIIVHDQDRSRGSRDWRGLASYIAIGAAVENASIAAAAIGRCLKIAVLPPCEDLPLAVRLSVTSSSVLNRADAAAQLALVRARTTNRKHGDGGALGDEAAKALKETAAVAGAHLQLVSNSDLRDEVGRILGNFDKIQFTTPAMQAEIKAEIRWTAGEVERTRDGIDLVTLELDPTKAAALRLIARPDVAALLRPRGRGIALEEPARRAVAASSALGMLRVDTDDPVSFIKAGRAMQRVLAGGRPAGALHSTLDRDHLCFAVRRFGRGPRFQRS